MTSHHFISLQLKNIMQSIHPCIGNNQWERFPQPYYRNLLKNPNHKVSIIYLELNA